MTEFEGGTWFLGISEVMSGGRNGYWNPEWAEMMKLHGTLQHMTFILTAGTSYLPTLSQATKFFNGDRHCHHHSR